MSRSGCVRSALSLNLRNSRWAAVLEDTATHDLDDGSKEHVPYH